jgi:hypothetical protein
VQEAENSKLLGIIRADVDGYGFRVTSLSAEEVNLDKVYCRECRY